MSRTKTKNSFDDFFFMAIFSSGAELPKAAKRSEFRFFFLRAVENRQFQDLAM